jgi:hypothetical protein
LSLVSLVPLGPQDRAQANARTLQLDRRAYRIAADVWAGTPRAVLADDSDGDDRR